MLHNISAFEFIDIIDYTYPNKQHTTTSTDNDHTLLADVTSTQDNISSADIRKVLSTTNSNNPTT